jgi:peptidyl-prolyl cis-trans isomerase SurA
MILRLISSSLGALLLGLSINSVTLSGADAAQVDEVDRIIAILDDDVVVRSELEREITIVSAQLSQRGARMPSRTVLERQVLERLILKKLQLAAAQRAGITIGEDLVAQALSNIARNTGMTISEFRQALASEGLSFTSVRENIRSELILKRLHEQEIRRRIRVTDQEVKAFLGSQGANIGKRSAYHLSHILVATPDGASAEQIDQARQKALRLVAEIRNGTEFASLALTESDGRQALEGGDLGWRPANQLPTIFADEVKNMERGQVSDPIRASSGYHIVMLKDFKGGERRIISQTQVRHILIATNEITSDEDARIRLEQLRLRIEGGDDFADLARSHSDDKTSAIKGGDLGWTTPGDLLPRFEEEIQLAAPGDLVGPFRTEFGWHLAQVIDRRQHDSTTDVLKAQARNAIIKRKMEEETELYLRRLRDEAYVDIRLDDL